MQAHQADVNLVDQIHTRALRYALETLSGTDTRQLPVRVEGQSGQADDLHAEPWNYAPHFPEWQTRLVPVTQARHCWWALQSHCGQAGHGRKRVLCVTDSCSPSLCADSAPRCQAPSWPLPSDLSTACNRSAIQLNAVSSLLSLQ